MKYASMISTLAGEMIQTLVIPSVSMIGNAWIYQHEINVRNIVKIKVSTIKHSFLSCRQHILTDMVY